MFSLSFSLARRRLESFMKLKYVNDIFSRPFMKQLARLKRMDWKLRFEINNEAAQSKFETFVL